jgi:uncharacterized protein YbcI
MITSGPTIAQQIAQAAVAFERRRTGHTPQSVAVVLGEGTLVVTLNGALSRAEQALARTADGAARLQEFHRQLFTNAAGSFREEIRRITGVEVREAAADVEPATGTVIQVFTTGTAVQVYLLAGAVAPDSWSGADPDQVPITRMLERVTVDGKPHDRDGQPGAV